MNIFTCIWSLVAWGLVCTSTTEFQRIENPSSNYGVNFGASFSADSNRVIISWGESFVRNDVLRIACIFNYDGSRWCIEDTLAIPAVSNSSCEVQSVALNGNHAIVAIKKGDDAIAYLFQYAHGKWRLQSRLMRKTNKNDRYGCAVALTDKFAFVAADHDSEGKLNSGAVYVFTRIQSDWVEISKLRADSIFERQEFGRSLSATADWLLVGSRGHGYFFTIGESGLILQNKTHLGGYDVSVSDEWAIVANPYLNRKSTEPISVYKLKDGKWLLNSSLSSPIQDQYVIFGTVVSVDKNIMGVGCTGELAKTPVFLYELLDDGPRNMGLILLDEQFDPGFFGENIHITDRWVFVSAKHDKGGRGAAYIYDLSTVKLIK
jgi:hypothetical protein